MKSLLFIFSAVLFLGSCSHRHKDVAHHDHTCSENCKHAVKYEKHCALSVSEGDMHVMGKEEFMLEHGGHKYYFSSKAKMEDFKAHIDKKLQSANQNWTSRRYR